ncbi:MAG: aldo/keto reductase [Caldilinea sp.]|nr:aldo/keto reductase [Caldilineaceae bacterium]MCB9120101.1 aldo/keto reductase [Caldilineaceae bacterium]MCO5209239.1 aldo/keto reductase [Caldilinea sp.]MCW5841861.1 aldo/keto reductase [Caldilinea sp.]HRW47276.1 aldo/keto reductase [Caldilinea sp.]
MQYRSLGRTGVQVTPLCLGAMNFGGPTDEAESIAIINRALDGGINFIDTANVYNAGESERIVGKALQQNGRRDEIVLATKVFGKMGEGPNEQGVTRYHIIKACEDSLRRLQTDRIDLYQLHRPSLTVPQDETLRAFDDLVRAGKVRYIGCSTFPAWKVMEALGVSQEEHLVRYISEQPPYNLLDRRIENELVPLAQAHGLALLPWSPLAGGILAGRYATKGDIPAGSRAERTNETFRNRITQRGIEVAVAVAEMAAERKLTPSQLALLWVMDQPGITSPILGPRTMQHLEDALPLLDMRLDDADRPLFDALVHPGTAVADFHNSNDWMKARVLD